ncbi:ring-cleaving dioxygenase [Brevibacillus centrosporus]|uniref:Glyoxalase family protein n=1 Tax=Brevibacillus centrosporus TaxID=54910 RepID=A0A1I4DQQ8_9BACL|nr:ring-cleaving dioxygenase [Brevibacillus centrosporus]MEC2129274.1 ring-cleaving dioxygenase [Brevibacillus centrosporus]MED4906675.1 ring-cleaving dioxygenase [Brevibacillus centrosporus]RNB70801.1 ring-cleaving dioxygenase [Brevibacillus centrosporus]SFK94980.1 glyoxalase family protein [Brevibacillus centrosporus]GED34330.1 ring-cleaving dioxygenase mhqO [Brevibacillus centrosporus]
MKQQTAGIHHITAFVRHPQENVDFYAGLLGLRLVKKTINFDAPEVYHLYFGNEAGSPGTAITFFPYAASRKGRIGGGQVGYTTFLIPVGTLGFWEDRLNKFEVAYNKVTRFKETYLQFADQDGLQLELVEREGGAPSKWSFGNIPAEKAIKGFGGAILYSVQPEKTMEVLQNLLGLEKVGEEGGLVRFRSVGDLGNIIDVNAQPVPRGAGGAGTVHHIAWRAKDDADHRSWREKVEAYGLHPTDIVDRQYFNALYFREYGEILFEIATDPPGFGRDEAFEQLGEKLMLPEWYEPYRTQIEQGLTPITVRVLEGDK